MKYILVEKKSGKAFLHGTIDDVIKFIIEISNGDFIEVNGYICNINNNKNMSIIDVANEVGYLLLNIMNVLNNHNIDYRDVRNLHLEDDKIMVVSTPFRTIKIDFKNELDK